MVYLIYDKQMKQVVEITEKEPVVDENHEYAKSNDFKKDDEFEQTIWVNEVDEYKILTSYSAIRNNPQAKRLLKENDELKQANQQIKSELDSAILELSTAIAMQGGQ